MASPGDDTSVQVALRIRPQSAAEKIDMCHMCTSVTPDHPQVILGKDKAFTYDFVFDVDSVQPNIYDSIARPLIEGCFEGYNATILAYGQTGSGKTYTMGTSFDIRVPEDTMGIIPRAARHLFEGIQKRKDQAEADGKPLPDIQVSAQFLELYNEEIIDLLDIENKGRKQIKVHEDHNGNIYMSGVVSRTVTSGLDCMNLLEDGAISRTTASTNMNATSSRSHAIFTLLIKHHRVAAGEDGEGEEFETMNAKFNFVDLAGSERLKRTGATGDRAKEGISINQGLLSLGNVISALGDKTKRGTHVPYRDSKLTRLLQDSLGGNSRTLMIACVSPSDRDFMETLNTLKYANRARNIKNKVMVNQDKASKQIAMLRQEIQQLTLELLEFKQGKRVADGGGEYMTDTYHELEMLRSENENLRMRMKALQQTIDTQTIQVTELKVSSALAHVTDEERPAIEELTRRYEKEIQELKNHLRESEAMSTVAVRRADNVSRLAMSPNTFNDETTSASILDMAKQNLKKELKLKKKLSKKFKPTTPTSPVNESDELCSRIEQDGVPITISGDEAGESHHAESNGGVSKVDIEEVVEEDDMEEGDEHEEDEEEEDETEEGEIELIDSESDSDTEFDMSLKEEEVLQDNINDLNTDITIKQKLIDELEHSQQRLTALKHQYDQKLNLLHNKIKETEDERDKVLKSMGSVDSVANEKANEVKKRYEKKLTTMQKELSKLQNAKREHQRLLKTKEENEIQLKKLRGELSDMKKVKVKLMRQMRDEANRNKMRETKMSQKMESVIKENRKKEIALQRMKDEKKQRDLVMKRKQQELNAMRKQAKPISGNVTSRNTRNRPNNLQLQYQGSANSNANSTFIIDNGVGTNNIETPTTPTSTNPTNTSKVGRSPAISKRAKQKWEIFERKITEYTIRMKNVAQMENDMERWLADRERIGKQLESVKKRKEEVEKAMPNHDEALLKELINNVEGLDAHMEYIQENITESQGTIMGMEEQPEGINPSELIAGCSLAETKYLMEHFYSKSIETAHELANKDAAYKEIQIKLEAMEKHCEVQQQLLQHACNYGSGIGTLELDDMQSIENDLNEQLNHMPAVTTKKTRRKTAVPEELLHPKEPKNKSSTPLKIAEEKFGDDLNDMDAVNRKQVLAETFQLDEKTLKKLVDLEKTLKDKKKMPPPAVPSTNNKNDEPAPTNKRSGSFTIRGENNNEAESGNFVRNSRVSSSARPYRKTVSSSSINKKRGSNPPSARNSPVLERKSMNSDSSNLTVSSDFDSSDVFKRLTSSLPHEGDPDLGQILPSKATPGKPDSLVCMYTATGHNNAVLSLDVLNEQMITGSKDRTAKLWDLNTSEEILSLPAHKRDVNVVKFSPVSKTIFTVNHSTIKLWDQRQGTVIKTLGSGFFQMAESSIMDLGLGSGGNVLYSAVGNIVKRIDLRTYSTLGKLQGHSGSVTCLHVTDTPRHHDIVITGSKDHSIKIFEMLEDTPQVPRQTLEPPHYDGVQSLAMKGTHLFSGSRDNAIKKWDFSKCCLEQHLTSAHKDWVTALNFVPGADVVVSADRRGLLKLWHVGNCKLLGEIQAHGKSINAIKTNSTTIFTASSDRLVRIWKPSQTLEDQIALNEMDD